MAPGLITLLINGEIVHADEKSFYAALEQIGTADESGIEVIGPLHLKDELEARINEKLDDDEEIWLMT